MAFDKGNGPRGGGYGRTDRPEGNKAQGGYRPAGKSKRMADGKRNPAGPAFGRDTFAKPAGQRPQRGKPNFGNDEVFDGASTRKNRQSPAARFFGPGNFEAPQGSRRAPSGLRPQGPGPRRAAPTGRSVPPSVFEGEQSRKPQPRREMESPAYPFKARPAEQARPLYPPRGEYAKQRDELDELARPDIAIEPDARENLLVGRNPIREAIKAGRAIEKLLVAEGELSGSARQIVAWAREARIVVQHVDRARLDQIYPNHQGMIAITPAAQYSSVEDILQCAKDRGEPPFVVVLDGITDPYNLGAVIRTSECVGAHGIILPERRSAGLNPAAVKAAAGACEYQRIAKVVNLTRTLEELKQQGLWVIGADMQGEPVGTADLSGAIALVIGSEGEGISNLVSKTCDKLVALPIKGKIDSLNASVAAGVLLYEVLRARSH